MRNFSFRYLTMNKYLVQGQRNGGIKRHIITKQTFPMLPMKTYS